MVELSNKKKRKLLEKKTQSEKKIKIEKPQPKETVKGNIGEHAAERYFKKNGIKCLDANRVIQKNIAGIDHIINHGGFCFSQSKVHIAAESLEVLVKSYETNIDKRFLMALAFIQKVVKGNKFEALEKANQQVGDNKVLALILKKIQKEDYEIVSDLDTDMKAVRWAGDAILFPVPKDIYPKLSNKHQAFAVALAEDADWFTSSLRKSFYMETKKILSEEKLEEKEDPTFEGEEEEKN